MGKRAARDQNLAQIWAKTQKTPDLRSGILLTRGGSLPELPLIPLPMISRINHPVSSRSGTRGGIAKLIAGYGLMDVSNQKEKIAISYDGSAVFTVSKPNEWNQWYRSVNIRMFFFGYLVNKIPVS